MTYRVKKNSLVRKHTRSRKTYEQVGITYLVVFFFKPIPTSQPDGLGGGTTEDKISAPAYTKAGKIGSVAPPEPWLIPRLQTKEIESS
jgi:hypothetical protein